MPDKNVLFQMRIDPRLRVAIKTVAARQRMSATELLSFAVTGGLPPDVTAQVRREYEALCEADRKAKREGE